MKPHIRNGKVVLLGGRIALVPCPENCCSLCASTSKPDGYSSPDPTGVPFSINATGSDVQDLCKNFPRGTAIQFQCNDVVRQQRFVFNSQQGTITPVANNWPYCCYLASSISQGNSSNNTYREAILSGRAQANARIELEFRRSGGDDEKIVLTAQVDAVRSDLSGERNNGRIPGIPFDAILTEGLRERYTSVSGTYVFERFVNGVLSSTDTIGLSFFTPQSPESDPEILRMGRTVWPPRAFVVGIYDPVIPGFTNSQRFAASIESTYQLFFLKHFFLNPNPNGKSSSSFGSTKYSGFQRFENLNADSFPMLNAGAYLIRYEEDSAWDCQKGQTCRRWVNPNFNPLIAQNALRKGSVTHYWSISRSGCSGPPGGNLP